MGGSGHNLYEKGTHGFAQGSVQQATIEMDSRWVNILSHLWVLRKDCTEPWPNSSLPKLLAFDLGLRHFLMCEPRTVFMTMQNGVWTGSLHTLRCRFETTYSTATTLDQISFHPTCFDPFCTKHLMHLWVLLLFQFSGTYCGPLGPNFFDPHIQSLLFTLRAPTVIGSTKPGIAGCGAKWHLSASQSLQLGIDRPVALGRN